MFDDPMVKKTSGSCYILTGVRQLLRILDVGLVVPELVASYGFDIAVFDEQELGSLSGITGYPGVPVLLELNTATELNQKVYSASTIETIHFSSVDELEDYLARGFQNVPNALFNFAVTPNLFEQGNSRECKARLAKIDRGVLEDHYRQYDVLAGLLWSRISQVEQATDAHKLLVAMASHCEGNDISTALNYWVQAFVSTGKLTSEDNQLLSYYLQLLGQWGIEKGWSSVDVLEELAGCLPSSLSKGEIFQKWYRYSKAVIANEKELVTLTDEGDVILRAILLHLLNPDSKAIERMAQREPAPGSMVLDIASTLAAMRLGFAPLDAADKQKSPGAYYLVSYIMAAFINRSRPDLGPLAIVDDQTATTTLTWHGELVNHYAARIAAHGMKDEGISEKPISYLLMADIENIVLKLDEVDTCVVNDNQVELMLTKAVAKSLPKQAVFSISIQGEEGVIFTSRLLDLSMKSHKAKLTGKRTLAALVYQTEQGADFRFETREEEHFSAQITLPQNIDRQSLQTGIQRLLDCHAWMKTTIK
jgi:hypothetical protein